jgi:hypothetical protein
VYVVRKTCFSKLVVGLRSYSYRRGVADVGQWTKVRVDVGLARFPCLPLAPHHHTGHAAQVVYSDSTHVGS